MRILLKEPEEIENPWRRINPDLWNGALGTRINPVEACQDGIDAVLDTSVEVDIGKMVIIWLLDEVVEIGEVANGKIIVKGKPFEEYLKEQLEV